MEEIRVCSLADLENLKKFINDFWSENHILSIDQKLLDFQHKAISNYNFVISVNSENEITAILGFIPTSQYDEKLSLDIWLAIWKINELSAKSGVGFALLKWLEKKQNPQSIGAIGINQEVKRIYNILGYKTGVLNHYYILNPLTKDFKIVAPKIINKRAYFDKSTSYLKEVNIEQIKDLKFINHCPSKSVKYVENRYLNHPYYKYSLIGVIQNNTIDAVFIIRKVEVEDSSCLRIVDIIGDYSKIGNISSSLLDLLKANNSEYIDCLNHGISEQQFLDWGFSLRDSETIIPNYFEPFVRENIDVLFAYKSNNPNYIIFKGDGDQDRPSLLK